MKEYKIGLIAKMLGGRVEGSSKELVRGLAPITEAQKGHLTFLRDKKYARRACQTEAVVIVDSDWQAPEPVRGHLIRVEHVEAAMHKLLLRYEQELYPELLGVEEPAFIGKGSKVGRGGYRGAFSYVGRNTKIGRGVKIFPHTYIGDHCEIGDHTLIHPGARIHAHTVVGQHVTLCSGCVVGSEQSFGFAPLSGQKHWSRIPHVGNVIIGDWAYIGVNTVIDRGVLAHTRIGAHAKIGPLCGLGHNADVGENTVMVGMVGIAGSVKVGKNCLIGGHASLTDHITIADQVSIGAWAGVSHDIPQSQTEWLGTPALKRKDFRKAYIYFSKLPLLVKRIEKVEKELFNL